MIFRWVRSLPDLAAARALGYRVVGCMAGQWGAFWLCRKDGDG